MYELHVNHVGTRQLGFNGGKSVTIEDVTRNLTPARDSFLLKLLAAPVILVLVLIPPFSGIPAPLVVPGVLPLPWRFRVPAPALPSASPPVAAENDLPIAILPRVPVGAIVVRIILSYDVIRYATGPHRFVKACIAILHTKGSEIPYF